MLAKRIIPCLDVRNGKVVKGVNFEGIKDVGDPVELAVEYNRQGADELVFYDITASYEGRGVMLDVVKRTAQNVFVPLCVGGGISSDEDFRDTLRAGADKVSGSQCVVVGIDAKRDGKGSFTVYINGGRVDMNLDLGDWVREIEERGAGEICLNSIDTDGVRGGFDIEMLNFVCERVKIPVIASGGCGRIEHFSEVFERTNSSAALAASLFHFGELTVGEVKEHLKEHNVPVRTV